MTDNRATELLCKLLEERSEDYTRNDFGITWSYYSDPHTATESMDGTLIVTGLTPEQAIAATLGSERELIDLAHNAWSMALCAMQGMPIPAELGDAVERGLREHGIDVDDEKAAFEEDEDEC